jgi:hypothetical protein
MYLRPVHDVPSLLRVSPSSHPHVRPVGIGKQNKAHPPFLVAQCVFSVKKKRRYQIQCAQHVSGITFIRDTKSRKIGKTNNLKFLKTIFLIYYDYMFDKHTRKV